MHVTTATMLSWPKGLSGVFRMDWLKANAVGGIIAALVVAVLIFVVGNNSNISSLSKGQENLVSRVDRIADELGAVGVRIAAETIRAPFKSVLLTTKPFEIDGVWASNAHLLDTKLGTVAIYNLQLEGPQDVRAVIGLSGSIHTVDDKAVNLVRMIAVAKEAGVFIAVPDFIDESGSFISYEPDPALAERFSQIGLKPGLQKQATFANTWEALLVEISPSPKWLIPAGKFN